MKIASPIGTKTTCIVMFFAISMIVTAFALSIPYREPLFNLSLQMIHTMQKQTQGPFLNVLHNLITFYAGTEGTFILMVLTYVLAYDKINIIVMIIYICFNVYIMAFLKVFFVDPRPYIYPSMVTNLEWKCEITYGFPSGHTWILLLLHEPVVTDVLGCGPYKMGLLYCVLLAAFVPWSRMYLGSHTADQLVTGLFYSFAFLVLYRYYFRQKIFRLIGFMMSPSKRRTKFLITVLIHVLVLIPPIILFQVNTIYRDIDLWQFDQTNKICHKNLTYQEKMGAQISDIAIGNIIIGFMYSLLLLNSHYGSSESSIPTINFLLGYWEFRVSKIRNFLIKKFVLYLASILFTVAIIYIMIGLFVKEFYLTYLMKVTAWTVMVIIWIRVIPEISIRYKLIQETHYQRTSMVKAHD